MIFFLFILAVVFFWVSGQFGWRLGRSGKWAIVLAIALAGIALGFVTIGKGPGSIAVDGINYWNLIWVFVSVAMVLIAPVGALIGTIERRSIRSSDD